MELNSTKQTSTDPIRFSQEETKELVGIRESYELVTIQLGQLELQKREIKKNEARILERLSTIEANEKVFLDKIVTKYGEGNYDNETGIFTPRKV